MIDNFSQDSEESLSSFSDLKTNQSSFKNEYLEACLNLKRPDYVLEFEKQINLRSFAETEIKTPLNFCFSQFEQVQGSNIKIDEGFLLINNSEEEEEDDDDEEDEEMSFEEEIENIFESSLKNNKKQQLRELNENIFIAMKKENLITNIKKYYSDLLKYHQEDIFILLQQHPKYNNFEVQLYTPEYFQLKCTKDNDSKTLILKKYNSFQSIDEEEQFINQRAINSNNLILTETIPLGRFYYLLTERNTYYQPNAIKLNTLIDEFFTYLNLNKSQEVARLYVDIIEHISLLKLVEVNGGLKIYGYNKLHKDFIDRTIELIKQQQKVSSLSIQLNDYFELTKNNLNFDCKNQFLEQNWRLSPEYYNQNQNIGFFNDHVEVNYIIPSYQNYFHSNVIEDIEFIQDIHDNEYSELINE
ncbi:hypothetical protein TTHERM_00699810 (macronuclear) [Tetrahymena thermophila SB210]|uniref:Uncharacterized protein n=1 Tax=Tetrahymena thermophila (strain SB210) TaxID=312017 RepID=Q22LR9_TETTS|nr:hypothetical protein TTHERM_00699810 [Tetrahymena thermophila SB210]EAR86197.2 hypothetical protein TTHERM_00699810 [Tetrahymena thermophila SB210]|eukprot:XP_976792.2 hypothetical protein TTHERM_00699810 [Tetrahymena thermophila SB210]